MVEMFYLRGFTVYVSDCCRINVFIIFLSRPASEEHEFY